MPVGADGNPGQRESSRGLDLSKAAKRQVERHGKNDPSLKRHKIKLKICITD
jgi:hypothetical protein